MTTAATQLPPARPFTPEECAVLVAAGIITEGEQAAVLAGKRRFTVDECLAMLEAGVLYEDDRIELIDGELLIMAPISDDHEHTTDWLAELSYRYFGDRARVRVQGSIRLSNMSAPQPDVAILRRRPLRDSRPYFPEDIFVVIEVANTSLRYDSGPKLTRYAAAGIVEVWIVNLRDGTVTVYTGQGSQFTSWEFTQVLQDRGVRISMDGKGRYQDNIFVERLWRTVKYEEVYLKACASVLEAQRGLEGYFRFYNGIRPHQTLDYRTPAEVFHGEQDVVEGDSNGRRCSPE